MALFTDTIYTVALQLAAVTVLVYRHQDYKYITIQIHMHGPDEPIVHSI